MATAKTAQSAATGESYREMKGDVEAIGAHCQMAYCHVLDFLPFKCQSCEGTFCLDHRSETAHKCPKEGAWARRNRPQQSASMIPARVLDERQCAEPSCTVMASKSLTTGVQCTTCNRQYCLKHRMQEDHNCKNLTPIGARPSNVLQQQRDRGLSALAKLKKWAAEQQAKKDAEREAEKSKKRGFLGLGSKTKSAAAQEQAEINALKRVAKGDASIPQEKRLYLAVEASADTTKAKFPTGKFFYNKDWSVGRVLDMAAKSLQVQNVNNRGGGEEEKLRVFHVEGGRLLKFSEKIGDPCKTGNMIVLLRGVGAGEPDLIDLRD